MDKFRDKSWYFWYGIIYFIYIYTYIHTDKYIYVCVTVYTDIKVSQNSDLHYEYDQL